MARGSTGEMMTVFNRFVRHISSCKAVFWFFIVALTLAKLVIVSDLSVHIRYSPFDDSLYVTRAFNFLNDDWWGPYDPYILAKLPGISLFIVACNTLGIPYILGINLLYSLAGLILITGMRNSHISNKYLVVGYLIYLANPITYSVGWLLPMREALSVALTILTLGISLNILARSKYSNSMWWVLVWGIVFACNIILREEDKLLWIYLILFTLAILYPLKSITNRKKDLILVLALLVSSVVCSTGAVYGVRQFNETRYGLPIVNDYSEGEFPRLMAALRSVNSSVDNRLVMLPQEVIERLKPLLPDFAPVLEKLPAPGGQTFSCKLQGICDEWSNGWMPWWVKQAVSNSGLSPTLQSGQDYFRSIRLKIEGLCESGALTCSKKGTGIIPPMELRWFRAYLGEIRILLAMLLSPTVEVVGNNNQPIAAAQSVVKIYQSVTMTSVTENPALDLGLKSIYNMRAEVRINLSNLVGFLNSALILLGTLFLIWRWTMYPNVPLTPAFLLCVIFWFFSACRLGALAYVAVFLGQFETRIIFSTYSGLAILGYFAIIDTINARLKFIAQRNTNA